MIRRGIFDTAINWQMVQGDQASEAGRWAQARQFYVGARGDYLPSRSQVEESYDAEERVLLQWADVELADGAPRSAYMLAQEAVDLRPSPARETVLTVRDLQARALEAGTIVVAIPPIMAEDGVRDYLGGEFEIELYLLRRMHCFNRTQRANTAARLGRDGTQRRRVVLRIAGRVHAHYLSPRTGSAHGIEQDP